MLTKQLELLWKSMRTGKPLDAVLREAGWTYDDLRYEHSHQKQWTGSVPLTLDQLRQNATQSMRFVSFFTGCGGMDVGLETVGWEHVAAFEINEVFCETLRSNRPGWTVFGPPKSSGDVSRFEEVSRTLDKIVDTPFDGLFVGGPPCQPFSIAANQRFAKSGDNFKRIGFAHPENGNLLAAFIRLVVAYRPKAFLVENVPGLRDVDNGVQLAQAIKFLRDNKYSVQEPWMLDAADYGVPQHRMRLFLVGHRGHGNLRKPKPQGTRVGAGSVLGDQLDKGLRNTETRKHKANSVLRYMKVRYGKREHLGRVDRLDPTLPSKTVIAGGTRGGGRSHLHPEVPRTLSVRECARLQSFPDDFVFRGSSARQFTQVGNAVPPVLAAQLGKSIMDGLRAEGSASLRQTGDIDRHQIRDWPEILKGATSDSVATSLMGSEKLL